MKLHHFVFSALMFCAFTLAITSAQAAEGVEHYTGTSPYNIDEYSRQDTSIALTFTGPNNGNATALVKCGGPATSQWRPVEVSGVCYSQDFCYKVPTSAVDGIKSTTLAGKTITGESVVPGTEGKVTELCYNVTKNAELSDVTASTYSKCVGSAIKKLKALDGSDVKRHCIHNYEGASDGIVGVDPNPDNNDDMFRIKGSGVAAFLEYVDRGSDLDSHRMNWFERSGGDSAIMMPTGPHTPGSSQYKDYDRFLARAPGGLKIEPGCYPANITMCTGSAPPPVAPPAPGICGAAHEKKFKAIGDIPPGNRCYLGDATAIAEGEDNFTWSCLGTPHSEPADNCSATKETDTPIVTEDPRPDGETDPPTTTCFFQVAGTLISDMSDESNWAEIGKTDKYTNLVGAGEYPKADPFARADASTFDGIALGKDTRVIIYSGANYTGSVLFDGHGPLILNHNYYGLPDTWMTATLPGEFNELFPPHTRKWSDASQMMWTWGGDSGERGFAEGRIDFINVKRTDPTTSVKVICD